MIIKRWFRPLVSLIFLLSASLIIAFWNVLQIFIPTQQVELSHGVQYGAVLKDFLFVQELTMKQRYLSGVDVYMAKLPGPYTNSNVFLLIDDQKKILFTKRFSSSDFGEALHFPFRFGKSFDIGAGKTVYACIYSTDGNQQSYIGLARKEGSTVGKLYVMPILQNDVLQSFINRQSVVDFTGTLGVRSYETDTRFFSLLQIILYISAFLISLVILLWPKIKSFFEKIVARPQWVFLTIGSVFGLMMLIITPPFQVPDEPVHYFRTWQVAEGNFLKTNDNVPRSLVTFADSCKRMKFSTHEKTSVPEILSFASMPLNSADRIYQEAPNYIIPYLPQAIGMIFGKLFGANLLYLLYLGRLFNLIAALLLVFLAIRFAPAFQWIFAAVGLLPMTLYQFGSLSYDAATIGLSFLLISLTLKVTFGTADASRKKELIWLIVTAFLLATSKPPYFLIALSFLIIPVVKIGTIRKYAIIFAGIIAGTLLMSQAWEYSRKVALKLAIETTAENEPMALFFPADPSPERLTGFSNPLAQALPMLPHSAQETTENQPSPPPEVIQQAPVIDPGMQISFILKNPVEYAGILLNTLKTSGNLYIVSMVGLFGWIDTQVPDWLAYLNLLLILSMGMFIGFPGISFNYRQKLILLGTLLIAFILIETALYLYCNPIGSQNIIAVQGRYFIAILPLLPLLLYSPGFVARLTTVKSAPGRKATGKKHSHAVPNDPSKSQQSALSFYLPFSFLVLCLITLLWSIWLILDRFFILYL